MSHGKIKLRKQPLDPFALTKSVVDDYANLPGSTAAIRCEGVECWVDADSARVRQMIGNLLENAMKYGAKRIALRVAREGDWARAVIKDDGQGIAPDLLSSLFRPFVQGAQPLDREQGGLGLGLALVDRLASLQGGRIQAHSEGGHEVAFSDNGADGLAQIASFRPDVALVDIGLPGMDGYEVARRARKLPWGKEMRIVALTGYGGDKHRRQAPEHDAKGSRPLRR